MRYDKQDGRDADEDINELFELRRETEDEIHDIPVLRHKRSQPDESPIQAADNHEDKCDTV